jgi:hypothetical protein
MTGAGPLARAFGAAPRWARRSGAALLAWFVVSEVLYHRGVPQTIATPAATVLGPATCALLLASAAAALAAPGPRARRGSRALLLAGAALVLFGLPASLLWRTTETLQVGEGQELPPGALPGLPQLAIGTIALASKGENLLLSKTVAVEARDGEGRRHEVGLWPPARIGGWRLTAQRFGYAPDVTWIGAQGAPVLEGYALLGTFPKTEADAQLVTWTPAPNVMMGVGLYPPDLEDLITPPRSREHLFLRLEEATLAGVRRNLRDPDAQRWLADGRPEAPVWFAQAFRGREKLFEGRLRAGEEARFEGGSLRIGAETVLWAEIQAVRDPWGWLAVAGALALAAGAALGAWSRRAPATPPPAGP